VSDAYYVHGGPGQQFGIVAGETRQVEAIALPAGHYTLVAHLGVSGGTGDSLFCDLTVEGDQVTSQRRNFPDEYVDDEVSLVGATSLTAPGMVRVACRSGTDSEGNMFFGEWALVATNVSALHDLGTGH
jgi:hypothetical protein